MEGGKEDMTETIQVALITGAVGVAGVIGALIISIIQNRFSNRSTRFQIQARIDEQNRQFEFEREQKAIQLKFEKEQLIVTRQIAERRTWITPLRTFLAHYSDVANKAAYELVVISFSIPEPSSNNPNPSASEKDVKSLKDILEEGYSSVEDLSNSMSQISDKKLKNIISDLVEAQTFAAFATHAAVMDKSTYIQILASIKKAQDKVVTAFHRVEVLLSGIEE